MSRKYRQFVRGNSTRAGAFTPLCLKYLDGRNWELTHKLEHRRGFDLITVPAGFVTDFASVPRFFWRILPPVGYGARAAYGPCAVVHDYLYRTGARPRAECDRIFLDAMRVVGVSKWRRYAMYAAVRLFGKWSYRDAIRS